VRDSAHACSSLTGRSERRKGHGNTTRGRDEAAPEGQGSWGELLGKGTGTREGGAELMHAKCSTKRRLPGRGRERMIGALIF
jgi:hypothetical protein